MRVVCSPGTLRGALRAIPSKSDAHRLLICAALADRPTYLEMGDAGAEDIRATIRCLAALGASIAEDRGGMTVTPIRGMPGMPALDCGESGATLRFLLPVAAALGGGAVLTGGGRLPQRPIGPLLEVLRAGGVSVQGDGLPLRIGGRLAATACRLPGNISSQFITGMLFAYACMARGGEIVLEQPLESAGYVDMTRGALARFGVDVAEAPQRLALRAGERLRSPGMVHVEGDWSNMALFLAAGALDGPVCVEGLQAGSLQSDAAIEGLLARFGARVHAQGDAYTVSAGIMAAPGEIDLRAIPDLAPVLAVLAAVAPGETRLTGAARLRLKESDRLQTIAALLSALGAQVWEGEDFLHIRGQETLRGGTVHSHGDHRIAMAAALVALRCEGEVVLHGAEAVAKSYPSFWGAYQSLGGKCHVIDDR